MKKYKYKIVLETKPMYSAWVIRERTTWWGWKRVAEFMIDVQGVEAAHREAKKALELMRSEENA